MVSHDADRVLAESTPDTSSTSALPHRQRVDLTVPTLSVDMPTDVGDQFALLGLCDSHLPSLLGVLEFRNGIPVVIGPATVLVLVDVGRNHGAETLLIERAEHLDREVNERGQV